MVEEPKIYFIISAKYITLSLLEQLVKTLYLAVFIEITTIT